MKDYPDEWLETLRTATRCEWCGANERLNTFVKLCNHCNEIRKTVGKLKKQEKEDPPTKTGAGLYFQRELAIAEAKKANCIVYGRKVRGILAGDAGGLTIEHQLSFLSTKLSDKDLFHGNANSFDWGFSQIHRQLLAYMLWELESALARKHRRFVAEGIASRKIRDGWKK